MANLFGFRAPECASTSNVPPKLTALPSDIKKLNDSVWEFYKPLDHDRDPQMEVIFFHGAQLSNDSQAFWKTWLSRDGNVVWPAAWLAKRFPQTRILFISYDSSVRKSSGERDTYQTTENLRQDIIWSSTCKAGQKCPVIFAGHCFGGIIIKDFLIKCHGYAAMGSPEDLRVKETKMFLQHCKAVFYYSTPNAGSRLMDGLAYQDYILKNVNWSIVDFLEILSKHTARINGDFNTLRRGQYPDWVMQGIGETLKTKLSNSTMTMVVPEASARQDLDAVYWAKADHFDVSRATNDSSCNIFTGLCDLVAHYNKAS